MRLKIGTDYDFYRPEPSLLKKFIRSLVLGLVIFMIAGGTHVIRAGEKTRPVFKLISNASLASSIVLLSIGVFSWVNTFGFFDVWGLGFRQLKASIMGDFTEKDGRKKIFDMAGYRQEKLEKGKRYVKWDMIIAGLIFFAVSLIFTFLSLHYE